jgi:hypothetical protein
MTIVRFKIFEQQRQTNKTEWRAAFASFQNALLVSGGNVGSGRLTMEDSNHRIFSTSFASVYPRYVAKAERKGRTKAEVDEIICWITGHSESSLEQVLSDKTTFREFFAEAPRMNKYCTLITGVVCGVRVQDIQEPTMREIRYLDKLVDELAKGKPMAKILRGSA